MLPAAAASAVGGAAPLLVERRAFVMGTELYAAVEVAERHAGLVALEGAFAAVRHADDMLSTWRRDSEIARLNAAPLGVPQRLSAHLAALLSEAASWREVTGGAFEPGVGALIDAWDLRGAGTRPAPTRLAAARAAASLDHFRLSMVDTTATRLAAGSWIDTGGFGKGAGLRAAGTALREARVTAALLNFGGQVLALGAPFAASAWDVPVAHPERRQESVVTLRLVDRSASTTSQSQRFVTLDGERFGHVLDPRSGTPVPAWGSVTVVHDDPLAADVLSTALFVMGPADALRWAARHDVATLVVVTNGEPGVRCSAAMQRFVRDGCEVPR